MPVTKNTKQQALENDSREVLAASTRKPKAKMLGTRVGTLDDWRKASGKGSGESSARSSRLRNGQ